MLSLLPTEHWDYGFKDLIRSIGPAMTVRKTFGTINLPGIGECITSRSARAALITALQVLQLPPDSCIAVPLYCCPVVFKAIHEAGYKIRFIDILPNTFCISPEDLFSKRKDFDAVVAVHMFGNLCEMHKLKEAAGVKPIIEDCAQSLGSKFQNRMTGSFGTVSFFSFRSGKFLSVGEGGALFSTNPSILEKISQKINDLPTPPIIDEFSHILLTYMRSKLRRPPLYGLLGYPVWKHYNKNTDYSAKSPIVLSKIFHSDYITASLRVPHLDSLIKTQRANADFYIRNLHFPPSMLCFEERDTFYNRYLFPIIFPSILHRDHMAAFLLKRRIATSKPYSDVVQIAVAHYGYTGDCPVSEQVSDQILVIPSHHSLKNEDVQRIARYLNEGWGKFPNLL